MAKIAIGVYAAIGAGAALAGAYSQSQAASSQKKSAALDARMQDVRAARERRKLLAQSRINRGEIVARGQAQGAGDSSGVAGGVAAQQTQTASGIGFLNQIQGLTNQQSMFNQQAADWRGYAGIAGAVGGLNQQTASLYLG